MAASSTGCELPFMMHSLCFGWNLEAHVFCDDRAHDFAGAAAAVGVERAIVVCAVGRACSVMYGRHSGMCTDDPPNVTPALAISSPTLRWKSLGTMPAASHSSKTGTTSASM